MRLCYICNATCVNEVWQCQACGATPQKNSEFIELAPHLALQNNGFKPEYFEQLINIEESHFWFRARNRLICSVAEPFMKNGDSFCEVGCGTGYVLARLAKCFPNVKFSATDIYSNALIFASKRTPAAALYQMDACSIPFSAEFDTMGIFDVLEHIEKDEVVLQQLHGALKPKGTLLITVPQHPCLWSQYDEINCHVRRYTRQEMHSKLHNTGFRVILTLSFVSLLFPVMYLSRRRPNRDYIKALQFSHPLSTFMSTIMAIEFEFIRLGVRFPFGGSLLVAAQKID